jgi:hypothetical protein
LLGKAIALLQGGEFEAVDAVQNAVEFGLEAVVGVEIESAAEELIKSGVEILFGGFEVTGAIVVLPCLVLFFDACDQVGYGIDFQRLRHLRLRLGLSG